MADSPRSRVAIVSRGDSAARPIVGRRESRPWRQLSGCPRFRRQIPDVVCNASFGGHAERGARAMTNRSLRAAILSAAALMTATSVAAQATNGVVPGANVTIREVSKNTSDTYVTDQNGSYSAPFLTPGTYAVEVHVQGF